MFQGRFRNSLPDGLAFASPATNHHPSDQSILFESIILVVKEQKTGLNTRPVSLFAPRRFGWISQPSDH